ncbi:hypothetical protein Plec18167_001984 [Paecilomyces lecythidis]|uniref:beta-glucosidase n=1 Tax=Paecilomyces lecythidis TaxID=3004212 RepID=A0ABR3Y8X6_9EURO
MRWHALATLTLLQWATATPSSPSEGLLKKDGVSLGSWQEAYAKASSFVSKLNNSQKLSLITGNNVNNTGGTFEALTFEDGSQGVEYYYYVSAFSQASALAMTWDKDAFYAQAKAVATEHYLKGVHIVNGPTSQPLGRTVWSGRLGETFSPDPYLNGIAFGVSVKAYTDTGVVAGGKHFLLNEQETNRLSASTGGSGGSTSSAAPYSSNADDKALHELYLWPFYDAVKNGMGAVMCAMNEVNNTLSCENSELLLKRLKTELGYPGMVYPDVDAQSTAKGSAINGLDYGSSRIWSDSAVNELLSNGTLTQARLNDMAIRNLMGYYYVHLDNGTHPSVADRDAFVDVRANHSRLIRANGGKSVILLKNTDNALPLKRPHTMSVFGSHARAAIAGPNVEFTVQGSGPTYNGHLATGTGSGEGSMSYLIDPHAALTRKASEDGTMIRWILNDTYSSSATGLPSGIGDAGTFISASYSAYAEYSDVCLVFLNALAGEGADRTELYNDDQDTMVSTVASSCNNTVVIINTVGARLVDQWIENENVTAVLYSSLLGQESGNSIVDILYGDTNPSGRLTYTLAKNESDYPVGICETKQCNFTEGVYIDYRYFDAYNITPRYPFGHGLSYTTFSYSSLSVSSSTLSFLSTYPTGSLSVGGYTDLWDTVTTISATITNTGSVSGAEVAQLYLTYPSSAKQPIKQLRGFERIDLSPGEQKTVSFSLRRRDISYWDVAAQKWAVARGTYIVRVGTSSRDLKLVGSFVV